MVGMPAADVTAETDRASTIAFFDIDNTLMRGASIFHLGKRAWRRGYITSADILRFAWHQARFLAVGENLRHLSTIRDRALELVGGHREPELLELVGEIYERDLVHRIRPECLALAREHLAAGHEVWLVSATPQVLAGVMAERLGFTGGVGTRIESLDGVYTGRLDGPVMHGVRKAEVVIELARQRGVALEHCWAYSDSHNDIPLLDAVGNRVVVCPDATLARYAKARRWPVLTVGRARRGSGRPTAAA